MIFSDSNSTWELILLLLWISTCNCTPLMAVQKQWPLRIDHILFVNASRMRDSLSVAPNTDVNSHRIYFQIAMTSAANQIIFSIPEILWVNPSPTSLNYSLEAVNITTLRFDMVSQIEADTFSLLLVSYIAVRMGYGITLVDYNFDGLIQQTANGAPISRYANNVTNSEFLFDLSNTSNTFAGVYSQTVDIGFVNTHLLNLDATPVSSFQLRLSSEFPSGTLIHTLIFKLVVINFSRFAANTSFFTGYTFTASFYTSMSTTKQTIFTSDNTLSTIYTFSGLMQGPLGVGYQMGFNLYNRSSMPDFSYFNSDWLKWNQNSVISVSQGPGSFSLPFIQMYRTSCNPDTPFIIVPMQQCYSQNCPQKYYSVTSFCILCSQCNDILNCEMCLWNACVGGNYFSPTTFKCVSCQSIHVDCEECYNGSCTKCALASGLPVIGGTCGCRANEYIDFARMRCLGCNSGGECLKCQDQRCTKCIVGYALTDQGSCEKVLSFTGPTLTTTPNKLVVQVYFDGDISVLFGRYTITININQENYPCSLQFSPSSNTLTITVDIFNSVTSPTLEITFLNTTKALLINPSQSRQPTPNLYYISPSESGTYQSMNDGFNAMSQNFGSVMSVMSASSIVSFFMGILWYFQIASYYLFLKIPLPMNLEMFLNTTRNMQGLSLVPFSVPNPFEAVELDTGNEGGNDRYEVDVFYARSNFVSVVSLLICTSVYTLFYLFLRRFSFKMNLMKKVRSKFVNQFYSNVSMNLYSVITDWVFTAAVTLNKSRFIHGDLGGNYVLAFLGLGVCFCFATAHPIVLFHNKKDLSLDTKECYVGINRSRRYSELSLSFLLLSQLLIPLMIPVFHPLTCILVFISSSSVSVVLLIRIKNLQTQLCAKFKIVGEISFMVFNAMFMVLYLIGDDPKVDVKVVESVGYSAIGAMTLTVGMEAAQIVTELGVCVYKAIRKMCTKAHKKPLHEEGDTPPKDPQTNNETLNAHQIQQQNAHPSPAREEDQPDKTHDHNATLQIPTDSQPPTPSTFPTPIQSDRLMFTPSKFKPSTRNKTSRPLPSHLSVLESANSYSVIETVLRIP